MNIAIAGANAADLVQQLQSQLASAQDFHVFTMADLSPEQASMPDLMGALRAVDMVLLLGLQAECMPEHHTAHLAIRNTLNQHAVPYTLVYGSASARLAHALHAIAHAQGTTGALIAKTCSTSKERWQWSCDKCSDPACEHRLFGDLLKNA